MSQSEKLRVCAPLGTNAETPKDLGRFMQTAADWTVLQREKKA